MLIVMDGVRYSEDGPAPIVGVEGSTRKVVCMATDEVNTDLMEILPILDSDRLRWKFSPAMISSSPCLKLQTKRWYGWATMDEESILSHSGTPVENRIKDAAYRIIRRHRTRLESMKFLGTTS